MLKVQVPAIILDLNVNDKIKVAASAAHLTNIYGTDTVYITKDTSITIVDLLGGSQGTTGSQGGDGSNGSQGATGSQGETGATGNTGFLRWRWK